MPRFALEIVETRAGTMYVEAASADACYRGEYEVYDYEAGTDVAPLVIEEVREL